QAPRGIVRFCIGFCIGRPAHIPPENPIAPQYATSGRFKKDEPAQAIDDCDEDLSDAVAHHTDRSPDYFLTFMNDRFAKQELKHFDDIFTLPALVPWLDTARR